ncbi:MAG: hypothetical protein IH987_04795, partial [Planctomycetes bacterium]|nr:hypothetical protein [Planctomycetota bacterium]
MFKLLPSCARMPMPLPVMVVVPRRLMDELLVTRTPTSGLFPTVNVLAMKEADADDVERDADLLRDKPLGLFSVTTVLPLLTFKLEPALMEIPLDPFAAAWTLLFLSRLKLAEEEIEMPLALPWTSTTPPSVTSIFCAMVMQGSPSISAMPRGTSALSQSDAWRPHKIR